MSIWLISRSFWKYKHYEIIVYTQNVRTKFELNAITTHHSQLIKNTKTC